MINDKVVRAAFIISLAGHCLLLGIPGFNLSSFEIERPEEITVRIEIEKPPLLPKIDIMGEEKKLKEVIEKPKPPNQEPEPQLEEIVMEEPPKEPIEEKTEIIEPAQKAMLRYQDMVKQRIEEVRRYPNWAKRQGTEGVVNLNFTVSSNGLCQDIRIVHSSGSLILDEEAVKTIKRADPFPPFPQEINTSSAQMEVLIVFSLR